MEDPFAFVTGEVYRRPRESARPPKVGRDVELLDSVLDKAEFKETIPRVTMPGAIPDVVQFYGDAPFVAVKKPRRKDAKPKLTKPGPGRHRGTKKYVEGPLKGLCLACVKTLQRIIERYRAIERDSHAESQQAKKNKLSKVTTKQTPKSPKVNDQEVQKQVSVPRRPAGSQAKRAYLLENLFIPDGNGKWKWIACAKCRRAMFRVGVRLLSN